MYTLLSIFNRREHRKRLLSGWKSTRRPFPDRNRNRSTILNSNLNGCNLQWVKKCAVPYLALKWLQVVFSHWLRLASEVVIVLRTLEFLLPKRHIPRQMWFPTVSHSRRYQTTTHLLTGVATDRRCAQRRPSLTWSDAWDIGTLGHYQAYYHQTSRNLIILLLFAWHQRLTQLMHTFHWPIGLNGGIEKVDIRKGWTLFKKPKTVIDLYILEFGTLVWVKLRNAILTRCNGYDYRNSVLIEQANNQMYFACIIQLLRLLLYLYLVSSYSNDSGNIYEGSERGWVKFVRDGAPNGCAVSMETVSIAATATEKSRELLVARARHPSLSSSLSACNTIVVSELPRERGWADDI